MALDRTRRRRTWRDWSPWGAFFVAYYLLGGGLDRVVAPEWRRLIDAAIVALFGTLLSWTIGRGVRDAIRRRSATRRLRSATDAGRRPLGEPYDVELDLWDNGGRIPHTIRFDEHGATFRRRQPFSRGVEFVGIDVVRVRASWIEIVSGDESVRVVPGSYADRERMLWELAVRWSEAIDRGIDETTPATTSAAPVAPGDVADLAPRTTGTGLASALAGPMDRGNPAPPRKTGLGNGLFVAPPGDA
jgi:hypothetical protein